MRDHFRGYYLPSGEEFESLWSQGEIVLDANVLLGLYRYSISTRENLLTQLEQVSDRLWLPFQAAYEYQRGRIPVMIEQRSVYEKLIGKVESSKASLLEALQPHARHPVLAVDDVEREVDRAFAGLIGYFRSKEHEHPDMPTAEAPGATDPIRDRLTKIYEGRVGDAPDQPTVEAIREEGAKRYELRVPPGYKDAAKDDDRKFGDLMIWKEIMSRAKQTQRPIIFVTDERKEDWWTVIQGKTVSPRPELVAEIWAEAQVPFFMYSAPSFLERAKELFVDTLTDDAVREVREVAETAREEESRMMTDRLRLHEELGRLDESARQMSEVLARRRLQLDRLQEEEASYDEDETLSEINIVRSQIDRAASYLDDVDQAIERGDAEEAQRDEFVDRIKRFEAHLRALERRLENGGTRKPPVGLSRRVEKEQERLDSILARRANVARRLHRIEAALDDQ